jgi:ABC-type phosphate transport system substrate-binding protein
MRKVSVFVLLAAAGCGSGATLSPADTQKVMTSVGQGLSTASSSQSTLGPNQTVALDVTASCPAAGSVQLVGSATSTCPAGGQCSYSATMTAKYAGCQVDDVMVSGDLTVTFNGTSTDFSEHVGGKIDASRAGQALGTCDIDITVTSSTTTATTTVSISGKACGQSFN